MGAPGAAVPPARRCTVTVCPDAPFALTHRSHWRTRRTDAPVAPVARVPTAAPWAHCGVV